MMLNQQIVFLIIMSESSRFKNIIRY